jgi:hypothetical protein
VGSPSRPTFVASNLGHQCGTGRECEAGSSGEGTGSPFGAPSPELRATAGENSGLKIPVSGVQFSPCPPFLSPAKRRNPALRLAIRRFRSRESLGMAHDPLGPFLMADWVPVWVPVFGGDPPRVCRCRRPNLSPMTSVEPEMLCSNRPPRTTLPTVLSGLLGQRFRLE